MLLLLLASPLLPGALAVLGAVPRLICDNRVLERYMLDAKEAENGTVSPLARALCRAYSGFGETGRGFPDILGSCLLVQGWRWETRAPSNKNL